MSEQAQLEIFRQHREGQQKFAYLLLAIAAAAIGFAVEKTIGVPLSQAQVPLGLAVIAWGVSFYCGCRALLSIQAGLYSNANLIELTRGVHPEQPSSEAETKAAIRGVRTALGRHVDCASTYSKIQYIALLSGMALFLIWHVIQMAGVKSVA